MKFELDTYNRNVSNEDLLLDLKRVAIELKKDSVTTDEYFERGKYGYTTFRRKFGTWSQALQQAGLKKNINRNITEDQFFHDLEEVWAKLGRQPKFAEMSKPLAKYSAKTYAQRFGTWRNALEKFVDYINSEDILPSERALTTLKLEAESGHKTSRNINWRLRFLVMRRDNFKCKSCGRSPATDPNIILHVDHIKAWANGGETVLENLQTLCSKCNIGKSDLE